MEITSQGLERHVSEEVIVFRNGKTLLKGSLLKADIRDLEGIDRQAVPYITSPERNRYFIIRRTYREGEAWHTEDIPLLRSDRISFDSSDHRTYFVK